LFGGRRVVLDAMVIINFHSLLILDKFFCAWAPGETVIHPFVRHEVRYSRAGLIQLARYFTEKLVLEEDLTTVEQKELFFQYCEKGTNGTQIHRGEAASLALALSRRYGLACDERVVREEFKKKAPGRVCLSSWGVVRRVSELGFITERERDDLQKGLFYT
jgi:predicted nucleic acid-binding protein